MDWNSAIHKTVSDHVADNHVRVFNTAHVRHAYLDVELSHGSEFATIAASKDDCFTTDRISVSVARRTLSELPDPLMHITRPLASSKLLSCLTKAIL
jgi:hypothetical protein